MEGLCVGVCIGQSRQSLVASVNSSLRLIPQYHYIVFHDYPLVSIHASSPALRCIFFPSDFEISRSQSLMKYIQNSIANQISQRPLSHVIH